jgi:uncharacterized membrane protein YqhA
MHHTPEFLIIFCFATGCGLYAYLSFLENASRKERWIIALKFSGLGLVLSLFLIVFVENIFYLLQDIRHLISDIIQQNCSR